MWTYTSGVWETWTSLETDFTRGEGIDVLSEGEEGPRKRIYNGRVTLGGLVG